MKRLHLILLLTTLCNIIIAQSNLKDKLSNLEGEWIVIFGIGNYGTSRSWEFKGDSVIMIEEEPSGLTFVESYAWKIENDTIKFIRNNNVRMAFKVFLVGENYFRFNHSHGYDMTLVRKSILNKNKTKVGDFSIAYFLDKSSFKLTTNIDSFEWKQLSIHTRREQKISLLNSQNCSAFGDIEILQSPDAEIIISNELGAFFIQRISVHKLLGISLDNPKDTFFFNRISNISGNLSFPINSRQINSQLINSSKKSISVGMPKVILNKNGKGVIEINNIAIYFYWEYWATNLIKIDAYRKRFIKEPTKPESLNRNSSPNVQDYQMLLVVSKLENGKFILSSSECNGVVYQILD